MKFYFGLKHPKMTTLEGRDWVVSALTLNSMWPFTSQIYHFIPGIALLISRSALQFSKCPFFLFAVCVFFQESKNVFFQLVVHSGPAQSYLKRYFPCCHFASPWNLLLPNSWCFLDNIKTSTRSMIFHVFYSNFSLRESLETALSEHLEWRKFQS